MEAPQVRYAFVFNWLVVGSACIAPRTGPSSVRFARVGGRAPAACVGFLHTTPAHPRAW